MKQQDIDKRIKEITAEAKELGEQRNALELLNQCSQASGHSMAIASMVIDLFRIDSVQLVCHRCGCEVDADVNGGILSFPEGTPFAGELVKDVYEIEDTAPLEAGNPLLPQDVPSIERYAESENNAPANLRDGVKDYIKQKENEKDDEDRSIQ